MDAVLIERQAAVQAAEAAGGSAAVATAEAPFAPSRTERGAQAGEAAIAGLDVARFRASLTRLRSGLGDEQRVDFDRACGQLLVRAVCQADDGDPAGPLGAMASAIGAMEGLSVEAVPQQAGPSAFGGEPGASSRPNANESAAIATLKNISSAQAQCQASGVIDVNGNGAGEHGSFAELSGRLAIRDGDGTERISPPVLSAAFGQVERGVVVRSGYCFRMFLPLSPAGSFIGEAPDGGADRLGVHPAMAEVVWSCYAWPAAYGESGTRAFFVDQAGDVLACDNRLQWSGRDYGPDAHAAMKLDQLLEPAANEIGRSGDRWTVVN